MKTGMRCTVMGLLLGTAAVSAPAEAQLPEERSYAFDLPAQSLDDSLRDVAERTDLEIDASASATAGLDAQSLKGEYTTREAIEALLRGTDLVAQFDQDSVIVRRRAPVPAARPVPAAEPIVVTGTRIAGAPSAAPVITVTNADIRKAGHADLGEVARSLPQNFGGGQNPGIGGGMGRENVNLNGASTFNLRGIGQNATLTLLNGNRFSNSGISSVLDISAIPVAAVEKIEIVTDGSSAIYGSDAVAGVVNILLRKDYEGISTSARLGGSTDGGNFQQRYNILGGATWSGGGFLATFDYFDNGAIYARDRSYTAATNPGTTLYPDLYRHSVLLSGHQELGQRVRLSADLIYKRGSMHFARGSLLDRPVTYQGTDTHTKVETFGVAPTIEVDLGSAWTARASGFYGSDRTRIFSASYLAGSRRPASTRYYNNRNFSLDAGLQGPLIAVPAGDIGLAIGGGMRSSHLSVNLAGNIFEPSRKNYFAYGELFLPLASPHQSIGLAHRAALTAALRWEDYSDAGSIVTPKLGLVYAPAEALSLGVTWGRSFKLATLFQQNNGYTALLISANDYGDLFPPGATYVHLAGANADLGPERSENWTFSATIRPSSRLRIVASFFNIDYTDRIAPPLISSRGALINPLYADLVTFDPASALLDDFISGSVSGLQSLTSEPYDPGNVVALLDGRDRNIAQQTFSGADLSFHYRAPLGEGRSLSLTATGSLLDSQQRLYPDQPATDLAGTIFNPPHFRGRAGATYEDKQFTLSAFVNYTGSVTDWRRATPVKLSPFATIDITARIQLGEIAELSLAALNVFNRKPEVIPTISPGASPFDSTNQSAIGRFLGVTIRRNW